MRRFLKANGASARSHRRSGFAWSGALFSLLVVVIGVLAGCVTPSVSMETPDRFAAFDDADVVRAVSPEGVLMRARSVPNEPAQTLDFWVEALQRHLTESGYLLVAREPFNAASGPGVLLEWLAPVAEEDWIYLTAVTVAGDRIALVESAGPAGLYERYRTEIRDSLATLAADGETAEE